MEIGSLWLLSRGGKLTGADASLLKSGNPPGERNPLGDGRRMCGCAHRPRGWLIYLHYSFIEINLINFISSPSFSYEVNFEFVCDFGMNFEFSFGHECKA